MQFAGTYLYGHRMYENHGRVGDRTRLAAHLTRKYADILQGADKVVYPSTLGAPITARTRRKPTGHSTSEHLPPDQPTDR